MYFLHPTKYITAARLRSQYCRQRNLVHLWAYLWMNWYNKKNWKLFARSSYQRAMPIARTTMIVESHWRVLKHNYKYNYNRPRLDHLITGRLIPDMLNTLGNYTKTIDHIHLGGKPSKPIGENALKRISNA